MLLQGPVLAVLRACLVAAVAGEFTYAARFEGELVRVDLGVLSNSYVYRVTNLGPAPIIAVEVPQHASYLFEAPPNWRKTISEDAFEARADRPQSGIQPKQTQSFGFRVTSSGAVPGRGPVRVRFQSGRTVEVPGVLAPVPEPRSYIALVGGMVLGLVLLHAAVLARADRRKRRAALNDA